MSFGAITGILGYDPVDCDYILSSLPSLLEYNSEEQMIRFHHGQQLLDYMSNRRSGINIQTTANQTVIRMLLSSDSYRGNLFGDLTALLFFIRSPTTDLMGQLKKFATLLLVSPLDVHLLDFTTFLDALGRMPFQTSRSITYTPEGYHKHSMTARGLVPADPNLYITTHWTTSGVTETITPRQTYTYVELLTHFVQFWASKHEQLDPLLLSVNEFGRIWEEV
ncbi:hypothetical protein D9619_003952 [Psilocybe cf. subviscida]|uniref:Uncharacterized protein n=1 Tax=Psilocybe cf. subviscida TaxID=2480587 RepID=A0A8H5BQ02_9AGAR|nr:hypothetical protein D9619_003952 [Psilocybe cf. subviscida]